MIRMFRFLLLGLMALALLTLALANRGGVTLRLLPEDLSTLTGLSWSMDMPLFLVIFAGIIVGVLIGFVWEWLRESGHRSSASARAREIARLERELSALRGAKTGTQDEILALLDKQ